MADNLLGPGKVETIEKNLLTYFAGYSTIKDDNGKLISRLEQQRKTFAEIEARAYEGLTGGTCKDYPSFKKYISIFFAQNANLYNDIKKIAVRKDASVVDPQTNEKTMTGIESLRAISAKSSKDGSMKVTLSADEIAASLSKILPIYGDRTIFSDLDFSGDFLKIHSEWLKILENKTAIAKKKGRLKENEAIFYETSVQKFAQELNKSNLNNLIDVEEIKAEFWPIYRAYFLTNFCKILEEKLIKEKGISATMEKGKVVMHGGLYPAIISARMEATNQTDEFFYHGEGVKFSIEIEGTQVTISPCVKLFSQITVNFSSALTNTIRTELEKELLKKFERIKSLNPDMADFSSRKSTLDWLNKTFKFSVEGQIAISRVLDTTPDDYFNSTNPSSIIGDLSEVLYAYFFQLLAGKDYVTPLGGAHMNYDKKQLENLDKATISWKQGKQPAVDLLLGNKEKYGIQVKNAFSSKALTSHGITFISEKTVYNLFLQEMREAPEINSLSLRDLTAQAVYHKERGRENTDSMWDMLEKVYSLFADVILDLGQYSEDFAQDKNVFYLYLSQYLIPASEMIQSVIDSLKKIDTIAKKPIHLSGTYDKNGDNLLTQAKISADYTFYNNFIEGFDILEQALELQE